MQNHKDCTSIAVLIVVALSLGSCSDNMNVVSENAPAPNDGVSTEDMEQTDISATDTTRISMHNDGFAGEYYSGAGRCSACHDDLTDPDGNTVSIVQDWSGSMMANSARDPYWMAKVEAELQRNPHLREEINDTCTRCHAPMANDTARKNNSEISLLAEGGFLDDSNPLFDHAMDGVSCTLCHQIQDDGQLGSIEGTSGNFTVAISERLSNRPAYGPSVDANGVRMQSQVQFNPVYGAHIQDSALCAACHDLRTPELPNGNDVGAQTEGFFPEQTVYSEWLNSDFANSIDSAQSCQSCHMPTIDGLMQNANTGAAVLREGFSQHTFLGANTVMQTILMNNADQLGISVSADEFANSIERNRDFIKTSALVNIESSEFQQGQLDTKVRIRNLAGHKLPSGFASRRLFVQFSITDGDGNLVFESGGLNSDGSINGVSTDTDSSRFEQHFDEITSADQVQVYEAIMGDESAQVTHTLLNATSYIKDNRLLPLGFDKVSAPDEISTRGMAQSDADFDAGGDIVAYRVDLPVSSAGPYRVSAKLMYQPLAFGHLQDLFSSAGLHRVDTFKSMFDASSLKAELIAETSGTVPVD